METDEEMALIACRLLTLACTNVICIRTCEYPDNREHENTQRDLLCTLGDGCYQIRGRFHSGQPNSRSRPEQVGAELAGQPEQARHLPQTPWDFCHRLPRVITVPSPAAHSSTVHDGHSTWYGHMVRPSPALNAVEAGAIKARSLLSSMMAFFVFSVKGPMESCCVP